jgi:excisionase family DNA binding protein
VLERVDQQEWLRIREAAQLLRVSDRTIRRWLAGGTLKGFKVGSVVRVDGESIDGLAEAHPYAAMSRKVRPSALSRLGRGWRRHAG